MNTIRAWMCRHLGHRWQQRRNLYIRGFASTTPIRCARCGVLAPDPFQTGNEGQR